MNYYRMQIVVLVTLVSFVVPSLSWHATVDLGSANPRPVLNVFDPPQYIPSLIELRAAAISHKCVIMQISVLRAAEVIF